MIDIGIGNEDEKQIANSPLTSNSNNHQDALRPLHDAERAKRWTTNIDENVHEASRQNLMEHHDEADEMHQIFEYGFGTPFSYWPKFDYYPYVKAKYGDLKEELMDNTEATITIDQWNLIMIKVGKLHGIIQNILGKGEDKNTAHAHFNEYFNEIMGIPAGTLISQQHIAAILFYTDLNELQHDMKRCCRKIKPQETKQEVMARNSEMAVWLRLLFEAIVLYGSRYSDRHRPLYHGLSKQFYFREFKAKFFIPTSTTTDKEIARTFAEDEHGIILEFCGLESRGDPFFDTASLSRFPTEKECLFFYAELPIKSITIGHDEFDMRPLSLYHSILHGNLLVDQLQLGPQKYAMVQKKLCEMIEAMEMEENNDGEHDNGSKLTEDKNEVRQQQHLDAVSYGQQLFKYYVKHRKKIVINLKHLEWKLTDKSLREKFVCRDEEKQQVHSPSLLRFAKGNNLEIVTSDYFEWEIQPAEITAFLEDGAIVSGLKKCADKTKFYFQMNVMPFTHARIARISLILHKVPKKYKTNSVTKSFDLYCKEVDVYVKFHRITFRLGGEEQETRQGEEFDLAQIEKLRGAGGDFEGMTWQLAIADATARGQRDNDAEQQMSQ